jgi:methylisocitrate lyase
LTSHEEFKALRAHVGVPLLANMTEFGKTPWLTDAEFADLGYALVLHPVTTFRLAAQSIKAALEEMRERGNQRFLQDSGKLMPRAEIDYFLKSSF